MYQVQRHMEIHRICMFLKMGESRVIWSLHKGMNYNRYPAQVYTSICHPPCFDLGFMAGETYILQLIYISWETNFALVSVLLLQTKFVKRPIDYMFALFHDNQVF